MEVPRHSFMKASGGLVLLFFFHLRWLRKKMCAEVEAGMPEAPAVPEK